MAGIDAYAYLTALFTWLPPLTETTKTLRGLTPQGWAAVRKATSQSRQARCRQCRDKSRSTGRRLTDTLISALE